VTQQVPEEVDNLFGFHGAVIQPEVEVPEGNPGDRRQIVPVEVVLKDRRLASRSPSAGAMRLLGKATFVDKDYRAAFPTRFFLMAGQCFFFHWVIASSSRSKARPTGRWELHPRARRIFQTWPR
jgi:hypothetical protein